MRRRDKIRLMNGQLLTLRLLEFDNESLTLWIRWDDGEGMNILDTRIHFAYGESMLAGLEGRDESGMILAIDVSPSSD